MSNDQVVRQLRALRASVVAALQQIDTIVETVAGVPPVAADGACPRCHGVELADAGDVQVCGDCGANVRAGEVVGG